MSSSSTKPAAAPVINVIVPPHRVPMPPGVPATVWASNPTLGAVPGQSYLGRITVEVFQDPQEDMLVAPTGFLQPQIVHRAVAALQGPGPIAATPAIWPNVPITGNAAGGAYLGRAVVELWSSTTKVAVTAPSTDVQLVVQGALHVLGG